MYCKPPLTVTGVDFRACTSSHGKYLARTPRVPIFLNKHSNAPKDEMWWYRGGGEGRWWGVYIRAVVSSECHASKMATCYSPARSGILPAPRAPRPQILSFMEVGASERATLLLTAGLLENEATGLVASSAASREPPPYPCLVKHLLGSHKNLAGTFTHELCRTEAQTNGPAWK